MIKGVDYPAAAQAVLYYIGAHSRPWYVIGVFVFILMLGVFAGLFEKLQDRAFDRRMRESEREHALWLKRQDAADEAAAREHDLWLRHTPSEEADEREERYRREFDGAWSDAADRYREGHK